MRNAWIASILMIPAIACGEEQNSSQPSDMTQLDLQTLMTMEVVIAGSRIRGVKSGPSPVHTLDRADIVRSGATSVQQLLRSLPQNFTGGSSEIASALASQRNGNEHNVAFGAGVNLRGLGNASTLVLLNGRRIAPGGLGSFVDVSTIPLSALERVEVVPDGASAIYGSDAVGGVVNFVLRDDFQGAETSVRYGGVTDGGLRELSANQLLGLSWASGSLLLNVDYGERDPLLASERSFANALVAGGESYLIPGDERWGGLIHGRQQLTDTLSLSGEIYANKRDAYSENFRAPIGRQFSFDGITELYGGTMALAWRVADEWTVTLAQTYSSSQVDRRNHLGASSFVAASRSQVIAEHDLAATELEAEGPVFSMPGGCGATCGRRRASGRRAGRHASQYPGRGPAQPRRRRRVSGSVSSVHR